MKSVLRQQFSFKRANNVTEMFLNIPLKLFFCVYNFLLAGFEFRMANTG